MRRHHGTCHERARQTEGFGIAVAEPSHGINARWTMISLLRTDEVAVDGIPAGRGLAQARWTIKRGFQLGLVDAMTGDRPVLTGHVCALGADAAAPSHFGRRRSRCHSKCHPSKGEVICNYPVTPEAPSPSPSPPPSSSRNTAACPQPSPLVVRNFPRQPRRPVVTACRHLRVDHRCHPRQTALFYSY